MNNFSALIFFDGDIEEAALYMAIRQKVIETQDCRASFLQRTFKIGYARAARFLDGLEEDGVISPPDPANIAKPRTVIFK
jgi:DNA segregation ATPase FtsK/SpoIIIE, S-DNA-T family